jgi:hypothetical protein
MKVTDSNTAIWCRPDLGPIFCALRQSPPHRHDAINVEDNSNLNTNSYLI